MKRWKNVELWNHFVSNYAFDTGKSNQEMFPAKKSSSAFDCFD